MNSLFSTGTLSSSSCSPLVRSAIPAAEPEAAVVPPEVGQPPARAGAADGGGAPALVRAFRTGLVGGQAKGVRLIYIPDTNTLCKK